MIPHTEFALSNIFFARLHHTTSVVNTRTLIPTITEYRSLQFQTASVPALLKHSLEFLTTTSPAAPSYVSVCVCTQYYLEF